MVPVYLPIFLNIYFIRSISTASKTIVTQMGKFHALVLFEMTTIIKSPIAKSRASTALSLKNKLNKLYMSVLSY